MQLIYQRQLDEFHKNRKIINKNDTYSPYALSFNNTALNNIRTPIKQEYIKSLEILIR
jgi:hypothetical protein